jgi:hypothetical protein
MRWLLAGLLFALAVALAIATAAIRAENARCRHWIEASYRAIGDRVVELRRLSIERLDDASPERLAATYWLHVRRETMRRQEALQ